ncbi:MAG: hypothetical protein V1800_13370 [Candidatus Latescibacterota bacterium]
MRKSRDYLNDDGRPPDGRDTRVDDTTAMRRALAAGPGVVFVEPGYYRLGEVTIPEGVVVQGSGTATVFCSSGPKHIFLQCDVFRWAIRDVLFDGEAEGGWQDRQDLGESGVSVSRCKAYEIAGVRFQNFSGAGLHITWSAQPGPGGWCDGGNLDRITAEGNYIGVHFDVRAEYMNATQLSCYRNVIGCAIHAGNTKIAASNLCSNRTGLYIEDKENGSHGAISNCLINHNLEMAMHCRSVGNGMSIDNCCFFCGRLLIEDSRGVNVTSGTLSCDVEVRGGQANRIAGNYIIESQCTFSASPATIFEGNFTDEGPWEAGEQE